MLLAVASVLVGGSMLFGAYTGQTRPETVVLQYFAALQRGDAASALGYGDLPPGPLGLVSPAVLAAQNAIGPIENITVRHVRQSGDTANVDIAYTVGLRTGPVTVADTVPVVRAGHSWRLAESTTRVSIYPGTGSDLASIAGARVPSGTYAMFPGAVPVTYDSPDLGLTTNSRIVRFDDTGILDIDATVTPAGRAAIGPAVMRALTDCLAGTSPAEALCPLPDSTAGVPGSLRGKVIGPANLTFRVDSAGGQINIGGMVPLSAEYQRLDQNNITGSVTVHSELVNAFCFAAQPTRIWWESS